MRYDGHGASYEEMKRERLERLAEDRKTAVNEREKAEDARNLAKMQEREEKKMEENEGKNVGVNAEQVRENVYADIRAALRVLEEFPELVRLVGEQR